MSLHDQIQVRMGLSKRQLATLDELELRLAEKEKISLVYKTIESDLEQLGYAPSRVLERLRTGKLYTLPLAGENNFRHYDHKTELLHLEPAVYKELQTSNQVTAGEQIYFPFRATALLDFTLLGVLGVGKALSKSDKQLLQEYTQAIGIELSPRYFRKEKDQVLKRKQQQMQQLMSVAIHDLRNQLTPMVGYSTLIARILENNHQGKEIAARFTGLLIKTTSELEYFQRIFTNDEQIKTPTNIYTIVEEIIAGQQSLVLQTRQIALINNLATQSYLARVDATAMELAFRELFNNAIKYSPPGAEISIRGEKEEGWLRFYIKNTGVHIPPAKLPGLFEREQAQGTGLGLSFVRRVIEEEHRGKITPHSEPNALVLEIEIPLVGSFL